MSLMKIENLASKDGISRGLLELSECSGQAKIERCLADLYHDTVECFDNISKRGRLEISISERRLNEKS
jgi:hypothetical protein